jgi:excisionase family DNA binding protein
VARIPWQFVTEADANSESLDGIEPLLSIVEVAEVLGISESGVYRLIRKGELALVKVGGRTLFERGAIRDFIADRRQAADSPTTEPHEEAA